MNSRFSPSGVVIIPEAETRTRIDVEPSETAKAEVRGLTFPGLFDYERELMRTLALAMHSRFEVDFLRAKMVRGIRQSMRAAFEREVLDKFESRREHPEGVDFLRRVFVAFQDNRVAAGVRLLFDAPHFDHDCERCVFYGHVDYCDIWYCPKAVPFPTFIARRSSNGPDYESSPEAYATGLVEFAWVMRRSITRIGFGDFDVNP